jgi:hypothetical protein|tara:strand:- start:12881 stop:13516 length:636 start_codon:yes stop_codon:yes gene_type:complete
MQSSMKKSTDHMSAKENQTGRLQQLEQKLQADDVRILLDKRDRIAEYLRLGRKWQFFALDKKASDEAGREIMRNVFMPESGLAVMIESNNGALENRVDLALKNDPKMLTRMLLDQVDTLNTDRETAYVDTRFSRDQLDTNFDENDPVGCVNVKPPTASWPSWFAVIRQHEISPADIEAIYAAIDGGRWSGQQPNIQILQSGTQSEINGIGV